MRLLHAVAFSKKCRWLTQTKVITKVPTEKSLMREKFPQQYQQ